MLIIDKNDCINNLEWEYLPEMIYFFVFPGKETLLCLADFPAGVNSTEISALGQYLFCSHL